jgi:antitoxin MazE
MVKRLHAIGNSFGIIIDRVLLDAVGIERDTLLDISTDGKVLTIRPLDETSHKARVKRAATRVSQIHRDTFQKLAK